MIPLRPRQPGPEGLLPNAAGSSEDIKARIREFYAYWFNKVAPIDEGKGFEAQEIQIQEVQLSTEEKILFKASTLFNVSGFIRHGFLHRTYLPALDNGGALRSVPSPFARLVPRVQRTQEGQERNDTSWAHLKQDQPLLEVSIGSEPAWIHRNQYVWPTQMNLQPQVESRSHSFRPMKEWIVRGRMLFGDKRNPFNNAHSYWEQLPGRLDVNGGVQPFLTPLSSLLRLQIASERDNSVLRSVLVRFLAVRNTDGTCRSWTTQDPYPSLPARPPSVLLPVTITLHVSREDLNRLPPIAGPSNHTSDSKSQLLPSFPKSLIPLTGSVLVPRYRGPLDLAEYSTKRRASSPPPEHQRRGKAPHPPSHALSHRQRFNYRQELAVGHL